MIPDKGCTTITEIRAVLSDPQTGWNAGTPASELARRARCSLAQVSLQRMELGFSERTYESQGPPETRPLTVQEVFEKIGHMPVKAYLLEVRRERFASLRKTEG